MTLRLPYHPPLAWDELLAYLAARAIPGVESVEGRIYRRTLRTEAPRSSSSSSTMRRW